MLVAAMNPCRCGHAYEPGYSCKRAPLDRCTSDYQMRISGPLMDRIDLRIEVPAVTAADLILPPPSEGSAEVAARVAAARDLQLARYAAAGMPHVRTNAEAPSSLLETIFWPNSPLHDLGVIVSQGKVAYAGVQFPLAESGELERELGSRHRAAVGMSQESDAVVLVVSEETGDISIAERGQLFRKLTADALRGLLVELLGKQETNIKKKAA